VVFIPSCALPIDGERAVVFRHWERFYYIHIEITRISVFINTLLKNKFMQVFTSNMQVITF
jgi:hypothetical protein